MGSATKNPILNTRKLRDVIEISQTKVRQDSVHRLLGHNKWHSYKMQLLQELDEEDNVRILNEHLKF